MLAANEAVAEKLRDAGLFFLRRVHGAPDPRKLKALTAFVGELGFKTESLESRFALQKLLDDVKGDPREHAVNYAALRSMQRAVYSPEEEGHFALASDCYCHFTSPIRRYPDLTIHRLIEDLAAGKHAASSTWKRCSILGDHCSDREQRAAEAERELNKVKLLNYLADKIGTQMNGVVTGVESFGLFVTGSELPAEGFIPIGGADRRLLPLRPRRPRDPRPARAATRTAWATRCGSRWRPSTSTAASSTSACSAASARRATPRPHRAARKHGPTKPGKKKGPRKGGKKRAALSSGAPGGT